MAVLKNLVALPQHAGLQQNGIMQEAPTPEHTHTLCGTLHVTSWDMCGPIMLALKLKHNPAQPDNIHPLLMMTFATILATIAVITYILQQSSLILQGKGHRMTECWP